MNNKISKNTEDFADWELPEFDVTEFKPKSKKYCFVAIILNEGNRFKNQLEQMSRFTDLVDIVIADGNSTDGSTDHNFLENNGVRSILVTKDRGLSTAIRMALGYCIKEGYPGIVTVDGNGKDGVDALPVFLSELDNGFDLIQGSRFVKNAYHKNTPLYRLFGIKFILTPLLFFTSGFKFTDPTNGFRALSKNFLLHNSVKPFRSKFVRFDLQLYMVYIAGKLKFRVKEIPVRRTYPDTGQVPTKISVSGVFVFFFEMIKVVCGLYNVD